MDTLINKIHFADCLDVLGRLSDGSVDLLLQDTPFGCTQNEWDVKPDLPKMWAEWERVTKGNGAMVFFGTQPFASELILSNENNFRYDLIWYKALGSGFLNANKMPMRNHEHILIFYRNLPTYNPQKRIGKMRNKGRKAGRGQSPNYGSYGAHASTNNEYHPQSVLDFSNGDRTSESDHPTQKPVDLFRYLIRTYSNPGDVVFDGYGGSGTTAIAAQMENRKFIVCENYLPYFEASQQRLKDLVSAPYLFADIG